MNTLRWLWLPILLISVILIGCQTGLDSSKAKFYDLKGKVVSVEADKNTLTLDHEDMPGFMKAMTMKFSVEKASSLEGIKTGDHVQGKLKVTGSEYVITDLQKR